MDYMTAKVCCFARAYHYKNNQTYIFEDSVAGELLGNDYDEIAQNMSDELDFFFPNFEGTMEAGLRLIVDKQLSPSVLARSAYSENKLANEKKRGCKQYLIFASGYDTFSIRNTDNLLSVYELDLPELIADKVERIEKAKMKSRAKYVPCNLAETTWKNELMGNGYRKEQQSFGSLLGISYYFKKDEFRKLLTNISDIMTEGSVICFDYPSTNESNETKTNRILAFGAGEQMKALYSYAEIKSFLQKCGFELLEHRNDRKITKQYFSKYNKGNPMHRMQAPVGVAYVLAMKRTH